MFRSVGYRGVPLSGVPFDNSWGVSPNDKGRVIEPYTRRVVLGTYAAGWIKRGPSGVIGTNKPDAVETVRAMLADRADGKLLEPQHTDPAAVSELIAERGVESISYHDWRRLDELEVERGESVGRPRVKFTSVQEMLVNLGRT